MERSEILDKLASGEITADDAAQLLRSPTPTPTGAPPSVRVAAGPDRANRRLRVRVSSLDTGRDLVNLNLPMALVEAGLKIGARYESQIARLDVNDIFAQIESETDGRLVDVENWEEGERVEIFVE